MPDKFLALTEVLPDAGPNREPRNETQALVSTGSVARESGQEVHLIDLLCDHGANSASTTQGVAISGELGAVIALLRLCAALDLPVAAALGQVDNFQRLLPAAEPAHRHPALARLRSGGLFRSFASC